MLKISMARGLYITLKDFFVSDSVIIYLYEIIDHCYDHHISCSLIQSLCENHKNLVICFELILIPT